VVALNTDAGFKVIVIVCPPEAYRVGTVMKGVRANETADATGKFL